MSNVVEINGREVEIASCLAGIRHENSRKQGVENDRRGPQSDKETDINGVMGEIASAKYFDVWPSFGYDQIDLILPIRDGITVDVKSTEYTDGHLIAKLSKKHKDHSDLFMLAVIDKSGQPNKVRLPGYIHYKELFREEMEDYFGYGYVYACPQDELHSLEPLKISMS